MDRLDFVVLKVSVLGIFVVIGVRYNLANSLGDKSENFVIP